jgi:hypothetical protein
MQNGKGARNREGSRKGREGTIKNNKGKRYTKKLNKKKKGMVWEEKDIK